MIDQIEEFNKYFQFVGYTEVYIQNVEKFLMLIREHSREVSVQVFDASLIAGKEHLYFAVLNALKAFKNGTNISKNLAVECLLYASAQRQIRLAVKLFGIKKESTTLALILLGNKKALLNNALAEVESLIDGVRDDRVLEFSDEKKSSIKKVFSINNEELESRNIHGNLKRAISELVIERIALLVTQR
jgi:KEOPS complex subunit Cgi121